MGANRDQNLVNQRENDHFKSFISPTENLSVMEGRSHFIPYSLVLLLHTSAVQLLLL
jgi:hypothetical protein